MAEHICPPWIGYLLINPLRKIFENPKKIFSPYVQKGMTVLEPGCGMGFFTLDLARMVGSNGRVLAIAAKPCKGKFIAEKPYPSLTQPNSITAH